MKKAVPLALVLIAGAAVILWFGNRLNSWILGGLIGGLASLLLSIPISLVLFSYFARQHDEHGQYRQPAYRRMPPRRPTYSPEERDPGYYDPAYALDDGEASAHAEAYDQLRTDGRNRFADELPSTRRQPPAGRSTRHLPSTYGTQQGQTNLGSRQVDDEEPRTRRTVAPRRPAYPGLPGSQKNPHRTRVRSNALRTARLEAARQHMDQNEEENDLLFDDYNETQ